MFFKYFVNEAKNTDNLIHVSISVTMTNLFDWWFYKRLFEALCTNAGCKRRVKYISEKREKN